MNIYMFIISLTVVNILFTDLVIIVLLQIVVNIYYKHLVYALSYVNI